MDAQVIGSPRGHIIPPDIEKKAENVWKIADIIQATICSLFAAFYTTYCFTDLLSPIPQLVGITIEKMRVISIVSLPFIVIRVISNLRYLVSGNDEQARWQSFLNISGDLGLFATNLSSFLNGFTKLTALSSKVAIAAHWTGFVGILLQSTGIVLETLFIIKSVQVLEKYSQGGSFEEACSKKWQPTIANLKEKEMEALSSVADKAYLKKHLIKRIHYAIGARLLHIVTMIFTVAATTLFLLGVPTIIPLGIGFGVVVVSLIVQPAEILIKNHFSKKFKTLALSQ